MPREQFVSLCRGVFEHSPHFAERAAEWRPYASSDGLVAAFCSVVDRASQEEKYALLRTHPELADRLVQLTDSSSHEQAAAGLGALTPEELEEFQRLNTAYRARFDFPFIVCARLNSKDTILSAFRSRLSNSAPQEFATALEEVKKIARLRLLDLIDG